MAKAEALEAAGKAAEAKRVFAVAVNQIKDSEKKVGVTGAKHKVEKEETQVATEVHSAALKKSNTQTANTNAHWVQNIREVAL